MAYIVMQVVTMQSFNGNICRRLQLPTHPGPAFEQRSGSSRPSLRLAGYWVHDPFGQEEPFLHLMGALVPAGQ
jgi:hypothetical protein